MNEIARRLIVLILGLVFFTVNHETVPAVGPDFDWDSGDLTLSFPTPSADSSGSVPIGNGENAANLWVENETGDLLLLLARTDSFDGFGRLLKPARFRISFLPESPFKDGSFQAQLLELKNGLVRIKGGGESAGAAELIVFVDANRPVCLVQYRGEKPVSVRARLEVWRTEKRDLSDEEMGGGNEYGLSKNSLAFEEPDTILDAELLKRERLESLAWYHRNTVSIWPILMKQQGFKDVTDEFRDPLMNRTFGGMVFGRSLDAAGPVSFKKNGPLSLESAETVRSHEIFVTWHTLQAETPEIWVDESVKITLDVLEAYKNFVNESDPVFVAHKKWWNDFWNRSHIRVLSSGERTTEVLPPCEVPLTIGMRPGAPSFVGEMAAPTVYSRALKPDEIVQLAQGEKIKEAREYYWDFAEENDTRPGPLDGKLSAKVFDGKTSFQKPHDARIDLSHAVTLACWVLTDGKNNGRLIDKCVPGSSEAGFLLDLHQGGRFLGKPFTLTLPKPVAANRWTHLAATFDGKTAVMYVDGKEAISENIIPATPPHEAMTRGYALQRYVFACAGRGNNAMKFNGSLFTVERKDGRFNPDYRLWGPCYWTMNTRLVYWPMLAAGDSDLMRVGVRHYTDQMPLLKERNRIFFNRPDSLFNTETAYFWGLPMMGRQGGFDWDKPGEAVFGYNSYVGRHWNGGLEMANMMLDYCAFFEDRSLLKESVVPYADAVVRFFEIISPERDANGMMLITEANSLETWWDCINPMPDVAGLHCVTDRLLALPEDCTSIEQREHWTALRKILAEIPIGDAPGPGGERVRIFLPAMKYAKKSNVEIPELYAIFPFQIYGIGRGELETARVTFERRAHKHYRGWGQDEIFAAHLGLADDAATGLSKRFDTWADGFRFPGMWGPNFDWIPDQDHGGAGMIALQSMLLQSAGDNILILPAWPEGWDVEFKLHAPHRTVVEAKYIDGKLDLSVDPPERMKDIVLP